MRVNGEKKSNHNKRNSKKSRKKLTKKCSSFESINAKHAKPFINKLLNVTVLVKIWATWDSTKQRIYLSKDNRHIDVNKGGNTAWRLRDRRLLLRGLTSLALPAAPRYNNNKTHNALQQQQS